MPRHYNEQGKAAVIAAIDWINNKDVFWLKDLRLFLRSQTGVTHLLSNQITRDIMDELRKGTLCQCCGFNGSERQYIRVEVIKFESLRIAK